MEDTKVLLSEHECPMPIIIFYFLLLRLDSTSFLPTVVSPQTIQTLDYTWKINHESSAATTYLNGNIQN